VEPTPDFGARIEPVDSSESTEICDDSELNESNEEPADKDSAGSADRWTTATPAAAAAAIDAQSAEPSRCVSSSCDVKRQRYLLNKALEYTAPSPDRPELENADVELSPDELEDLFLICADYGIAWFLDEATRRDKGRWRRMVECLALLHYSFGVLEAWVEKYHLPLHVGDDLVAVLNISSEAMRIYITKPQCDIRKMITAHEQWSIAVSAAVQRLIGRHVQRKTILANRGKSY
jgi:hypothetical protein